MKKLGALLLSLTLVLALFPMTASAAAGDVWFYKPATGVAVGTSTATELGAILSAAVVSGDTVVILNSGTYTWSTNPVGDTSGITLILNGATFAASGSTQKGLDLKALYTVGGAKISFLSGTGIITSDLKLNGVPILGATAIKLSAVATDNASYESIGTPGTATPVAATADAAALYTSVLGKNDYKLTLLAGALTLGNSFTLPAGSELVLNSALTSLTVTATGTLNVNGKLTAPATAVLISTAGVVNVGTSGEVSLGENWLAGEVNIAGTATVEKKLTIAKDSTVTGTLILKTTDGVLDILTDVNLQVDGTLSFASTVTMANALASTGNNGILYITSRGTLDLGALQDALDILGGFEGDSGILWLGTNASWIPTNLVEEDFRDIFGARLYIKDDATGGGGSGGSGSTTITGPKGSNLSTPLNKGGKYAITNVVRDGNGNLVVTVIGAANLVNGISINGVSLSRDYDFVVGASGILSTITVNSASIPTSGTLNINVKFVNDGSATASAVR